MATRFVINPLFAQPRQITQVVELLRQGAIMLYPTDTVYAIGCDLKNKQALDRVRQLKRLSNDKPLTFLCPSLSDIATYALVSDPAYRFIRRLIPGPYTFLLPATKLVPKLVLDPKRKTTGIRVPDHPICQALLKELNNPIISTSAKIEPSTQLDYSAHSEADLTQDLFEHVEKQVDVIIDDQSPFREQVSTVIDMTDGDPVLVRKGLGYEAVADLDFALP